MSVWIKLPPAYVAHCDRYALRRQTSAEQNDRPSTRGAPKDPRLQLVFNTIGLRCECAMYLFLLPYYPALVWHCYTDGPLHGRPDLDIYIDVKGRSLGWHQLPVQPNDPEDWAYPLVRAHLHPWYEIVGWCWGKEAQTLPKFDPRGGSDKAHFVKPTASFWKAPHLLGWDLYRRHRHAGFASPWAANSSISCL